MIRTFMTLGIAMCLLICSPDTEAGSSGANSRSDKIGLIKAFNLGDVAVWRATDEQDPDPEWTIDPICSGLAGPDSYKRAVLPVSNTQAFDQMYGLLVAAKVHFRKVRFYLQGCMLLQGKYYPVITSVELQ